MRFVVTAIACLLLGGPADALPPKAPPVATPPKAPAVDVTPRATEYERVYARVLSGERVTVVVGSYGMDGAPVKIAQGVWLFYLDDRGVPTMRQEVSQTRANPFQPGDTTVGTSAQPAGAPSSSSPGSTPTGLIRIGAPTTAPFGGTENCPEGRP